ncbi:MAG: hypothetical protein ACLFPA_06785 [Dichotomicrobium sp.]
MQLKHLALGAALIMLAFGATACGKRGPLEPPPGPEKTAKAERTAGDGEVVEKRENAAEKRHEPFILDVLL